LSKFSVGDTVKVVGSGVKSYNGILGEIVEEDKGVMHIKVTESPTIRVSVGSRLFFSDYILEKVNVREVGKTVKPEHVRTGDKIETTFRTERGVEILYRGVVERIHQTTCDNLRFASPENGTLYNSSWSDLPGHQIILLEAGPEKHPLEDAKAGSSFSYKVGDSTYSHRKYEMPGWWAVEVWKDSLIRVEIITEVQARNVFDYHKPVLRDPDGN
jgi:RNase P/RNase MRP subunit p29